MRNNDQLKNLQRLRTKVEKLKTEVFVASYQNYDKREQRTQAELRNAYEKLVQALVNVNEAVAIHIGADDKTFQSLIKTP